MSGGIWVAIDGFQAGMKLSLLLQSALTDMMKSMVILDGGSCRRNRGAGSSVEVLTMSQDTNLNSCAGSGSGGAVTDRGRMREIFCCSSVCLGSAILLKKTDSCALLCCTWSLRTAWACSHGRGRRPRKRAEVAGSLVLAHLFPHCILLPKQVTRPGQVWAGGSLASETQCKTLWGFCMSDIVHSML